MKRVSSSQKNKQKSIFFGLSKSSFTPLDDVNSSARNSRDRIFLLLFCLLSIFYLFSQFSRD